MCVKSSKEGEQRKITKESIFADIRIQTKNLLIYLVFNINTIMWCLQDNL